MTDVVVNDVGPGWRVGRGGIEVAHAVAASIATGAALVCAFASIGFAALLVGVLGALLNLVGMLVARALAPLLGDLYRQLQYRERFLLFLVHLGLVFVPWATRMASMSTALMGLLLVLAFQCIDRLFVARHSAVQWILVMMGAAAVEPGLPGWPFLLFGGSWFLALRLSHIRFRLEAHDRSGLELPLGELSLRSLLRVLPIVIAGAACWLAAAPNLTPRALTISMRPVTAGPGPGSMVLSVTTVFWTGLAIVGIIVGLLVALHLLDEMLRKKQKTSVPEGEPGSMTGSRSAAAGSEVGELLELAGDEPRQRVLKAYRHLYTVSGGPTGELHSARTAATWLSEKGVTTSGIAVFDRACYSVDAIGEAEAEAFVAEVRLATSPPRQSGV